MPYCAAKAADFSALREAAAVRTASSPSTSKVEAALLEIKPVPRIPKRNVWVMGSPFMLRMERQGLLQPIIRLGTNMDSGWKKVTSISTRIIMA